MMGPEQLQAWMRWAYAHDGPAGRGLLRERPEDFVVEEDLGFEPSGEGQHRLIQLRKRQTNTDWLARQLARYAGVEPRQVSYAGQKDRNAVTTQWFSVDLAGKAEPDWSGFKSEAFEVLQSHPHNKKLRRGSLRGNRFVISLKQVQADSEVLQARLDAIRERGVPNYFGEQRFGHNGGNLVNAWKMFQREIKVKDRNRKGMYLSAARSLLFNAVTNRRVLEQTWDAVLPGEAAMLAGSQSFFGVESVDAEILGRVRTWDIHPSGPMWGRGRSPAGGEAAELEQAVLADFADWLAPLEHAGLSQERRALRLKVEGLNWQWLGDSTLQLSFHLPAGSYATAVIRELLHTESPMGE